VMDGIGKITCSEIRIWASRSGPWGVPRDMTHFAGLGMSALSRTSLPSRWPFPYGVPLGLLYGVKESYDISHTRPQQEHADPWGTS
jgi:hypothetical protein